MVDSISKETYYNEYCPVCKQRGCITQNIRTIHVYKCDQSIGSNLLCNRSGCCHGCQCTLASSCPGPEEGQCSCDCHKEKILIYEKNYTSVKIHQFQFNKGDIEYNKQDIEEDDLDYNVLIK